MGMLLLAAAITAALVGCSASASTPSPTTSGLATPSMSQSASPAATVTATETETTTVTATPQPTSDTTFIGKVVYIRLVHIGSGCDKRFATDIVLETEEGAYGVMGVHFYDAKGQIGQGDQLGSTVRVVVPPENFSVTYLERGSEPFPTSSHCTKGEVPDSLYGEQMIEGLPYNAATWYTLPTP